ncbi:hypothetical protein PF011_g20033 [Phytophthora fragariae]|uniref:HAT C-terminal dimerisation domain-containing protein n=1 Tax=Phytophthora fragariae TaxID=53985 RepID=A0A6A3J266_9STRA|nr:hypothetical protein PF011_g20033 [Phytophthora fragariae]
MDCLPLSFCERDLVRRNAKLPRVCVKTLKLYLDGMVEVVTLRIIEILPRRYGIVLDGWTSGGRHYIAIFAVFNNPSLDGTRVPRSSDYHDDLEYHSRRFVLLAFCPMEDEGDLSARSLFDLIADTLSKYEQPWEAVAFMVGDNCSVNQSIGRRVGAIPLIGCASLRFALAVKDFMQSDEGLLEKVHKLMKKLCTVKGRALLRSYTSLAPVMRNDTRCSSTHAMLQRYTLEPFLRSLDAETVSVSELEPLLLTRAENLRVTSLLKDLDNFESVTKTLQGTTLTLSAARRLFYHAISKYPELKPRLAQSAAIVNYPALESGLVKIQRGLTLTAAERTACAEFRVPDAEDGAEDQGDEPSTSFVAQAYKRRKTTKRSAYVDVGYVLPTSNECERLFSRAKLIFSDLRKSMDRVTLETLVVLHCNRSLWNVYTVDEVRLNIHRNSRN